MTSQTADVAELSVHPEPPAQLWSAGSDVDGLDDRLEIARLEANTRVAVRDSRYPTGPVLIFTLAGWNALLGQKPALVDLR